MSSSNDCNVLEHKNAGHGPRDATTTVAVFLLRIAIAYEAVVAACDVFFQLAKARGAVDTAIAVAHISFEHNITATIARRNAAAPDSANNDACFGFSVRDAVAAIALRDLSLNMLAFASIISACHPNAHDGDACDATCDAARDAAVGHIVIALHEASVALATALCSAVIHAENTARNAKEAVSVAITAFEASEIIRRTIESVTNCALVARRTAEEFKINRETAADVTEAACRAEAVRDDFAEYAKDFSVLLPFVFPTPALDATDGSPGRIRGLARKLGGGFPRLLSLVRR